MIHHSEINDTPITRTGWWARTKNVRSVCLLIITFYCTAARLASNLPPRFPIQEAFKPAAKLTQIGLFRGEHPIDAGELTAFRRNATVIGEQRYYANGLRVFSVTKPLHISWYQTYDHLLMEEIRSSATQQRSVASQYLLSECRTNPSLTSITLYATTINPLQAKESNPNSWSWPTGIDLSCAR
jgi:hypothetical protein